MTDIITPAQRAVSKHRAAERIVAVVEIALGQPKSRARIAALRQVCDELDVVAGAFRSFAEQAEALTPECAACGGELDPHRRSDICPDCDDESFGECLADAAREEG